MEFNNVKPIFLQICDYFYEQILSGQISPEQRIPSVREEAADIGVNPNTVMRAYEKMTLEGIIYNKRGIGYFTADNAKDLVLEKEREYFLEKEVPQIKQKLSLLGLNYTIFE